MVGYVDGVKRFLTEIRNGNYLNKPPRIDRFLFRERLTQNRSSAVLINFALRASADAMPRDDYAPYVPRRITAYRARGRTVVTELAGTAGRNVRREKRRVTFFRFRVRFFVDSPPPLGPRAYNTRV